MLDQYTCERCDAPFLAKPSAHRRFCSQSCAIATRNERTARHGLTRSPEWEAWNCMRDRCLNQNLPSWPGYGGRGITVCDVWRDSFEAFYAYVGQRPSPDYSLDRIDNNRGYEPDNVRWSTRTEQGRNKRNNHLLTLDGETRCVSEWAEVIGIRATTLFRRIRKGWTVERALTTGKDARKIAAASRNRGPSGHFA